MDINRPLGSKAYEIWSGVVTRHPVAVADRVERTPGGRVYVVLSSSCNLAAFAEMIEKAGMTGHPVSKKSFVLESIIVYELRRSPDAVAAYGSERSPSLVEL